MVFNPISYFNKCIKTKDDMQVMLVILFIAFIIGVKIYMMAIGGNSNPRQNSHNYTFKDSGLRLLQFHQNTHFSNSAITSQP
jgi:hypothetical protein